MMAISQGDQLYGGHLFLGAAAAMFVFGHGSKLFLPRSQFDDTRMLS
jgi:hypothetical protein